MTLLFNSSTQYASPAIPDDPPPTYLSPLRAKVPLDKLAELLEDGWEEKRIAAFFGINREGWSRLRKTWPEFREVLDRWKEMATRTVEQKLFERACGYSHPETKVFAPTKDCPEPTTVETTRHYPPDVDAAKFWLTNNAPDKWANKQVQELHHVHEELSDEELARRLAHLLDRAERGGVTIDVDEVREVPDDEILDLLR